jgi:hypothetical protein
VSALAAALSGSPAWSAGYQGDCTYADGSGDGSYTGDCDNQGDCTYTDGSYTGDCDNQGDRPRHKSRRQACLHRANRMHGKSRRAKAVKRCRAKYKARAPRRTH